MLCPFFPRRPHLFASPLSSPSTAPCLLLSPLRVPCSSRGVEGLELCKLGLAGLEDPPRIAETEECAHRGFFRMADVTVMHSVVTKATGSTATEMLVLAIVLFSWGGLKLLLVEYSVKEMPRPRVELAMCPGDWESTTPLLILS